MEAIGHITLSALLSLGLLSLLPVSSEHSAIYLPLQKAEKEYSLLSLLCAQPAVSQPSSVLALHPSDISVLSAIEFSRSQSSKMPQALSQLSELLSIFNPNHITLLPDQSSQDRSLSQQVADLVISLQSHEDWKLVLLFVPVDQLCTCPEQAKVVVGEVLLEVTETLQTLYQQLRQTLVHIVILTGDYTDVKRTCQCSDTQNASERQMLMTILAQSLQESLENHLLQNDWFSYREDFTVLLQLQPVAEQSAEESNNAITTMCHNEYQPLQQTSKRTPTELLQEELITDVTVLLKEQGRILTCEDRSPSPSPPTSVHALRPADIKVMAAVGDSLTAGNGLGASNLLQVLQQYRGLSWSIGGDGNLSTVATLPNILREFNPSLTGFSLGIGNNSTEKAFLNQAVPGAESKDMIGQVQALVNRMKNDARIDFQNDWKVITMFVGGNDLCEHCRDMGSYTASHLESNMHKALDFLHKEVPRALVNLVELLDIVPLRRLHLNSSLGCPTWLVKTLCPCVIAPEEFSTELELMIDHNRAYQRAIRELAETGRYDTHDNFTVVLQPFFREVVLPVLEDGRPDRSFFTPDCFHLSRKAHSLMAGALWNNMLEPVGNKTTSQDFSYAATLKCPSKDAPFLRTYKNSNYTYPGPVPTLPPITNWGSNLSCINKGPSESIPSSVHRLRPADVKVIAALGDSLTAGFGARVENTLEFTTEYRGVSWSIGGDETLDTVTTLPNILKKFNPFIQGSSQGVGSAQKGFNMAVSGAKAFNIPTQVQNLIQAMKESEDMDFINDWKMVTLFIGSNDLCQYCQDQIFLSSQNYSYYLMESLDMLYREMPRVLVNMVEILLIQDLRKVNSKTQNCSLLQRNVCPCVLNPGEDSLELSEVKRINLEYQIVTERLVYSGRYEGRKDFAVVLQPFFRNTIIPLASDGKPDLSFFSRDCFHFSERGQAEMAISLWNNMLEPVGNKQDYNNFTYDRTKLKCPTEAQPYIFTRLNSFPGPTSMPPVRPTSTPVTVPQCSGAVPLWGTALLAVSGLIIGWGVTWLFLAYRERSNKRSLEVCVEMKGSSF